MKRIVIIGATGTGKSSLAEALAQKIGAPVIDLDELYWQPGWVHTPPAVFQATVGEKTMMDRWIAPGNYGILRDMLWSRADTIIWLDYSFGLVFRHLLLRTWRRIVERQIVCNGNLESWGRLFSRHSILLWLIRSYRSKRREYGRIFRATDGFGGVRFIRLRTPHETLKFLNEN